MRLADQYALFDFIMQHFFEKNSPKQKSDIIVIVLKVYDLSNN